mgnify:CR=1 FL=1
MTEATLPAWDSVLAVVAHPDDESFALGAVLSAFTARGSRVSILCLTRGEASTLRGVVGDLAEIRAKELAEAAEELSITDVTLCAYPDGGLPDVDGAVLRHEVMEAAEAASPDGFIVFDPSGVTGHPDHQCATVMATDVAETLGLPVLGWTVPNDVANELNAEFGTGFIGHHPADIDLVLPVNRAAQRRALVCHPSQAVPGSALWRRLDLLGDAEHLRGLSSQTYTRHSPAPGRSPETQQQEGRHS